MARFQRAPGAAGAEVDGQVVVVSPADLRYHSLNATGARIWELLERPVTTDEVVATLVEEYQVEPRACRSSVQRYLRTMVDAGVAVESPAPSADP